MAGHQHGQVLLEGRLLEVLVQFRARPGATARNSRTR